MTQKRNQNLTTKQQKQHKLEWLLWLDSKKEVKNNKNIIPKQQKHNSKTTKTHSKLASYKDSHLTPKQKTKQEQLTLTKYQKT